jgi:beta-lactamase regulating signal transducer with metallopeptidase domain
MTTLLEPSHPFWAWLTRVSWQASVLVLLVLAVQWLFRKQLAPRGRCLLWWLVVIRLALPVSPPSRLSIFNWVGWSGGGLPTVVAAPTPEADPVLPTLPVTAANPTRPGNRIATEPAPHLEFPQTSASPAWAGTTPTSEGGQGRFVFPWRRVLVWLWFAGFGSLAGQLGWSWRRLRRDLRQATPVTDDSVLSLLDRCREEMGVRRRLLLLETSVVAGPALCGLFSPRLLLPPGLIRSFTGQELRFVFLHELAHLKRGDIAANWLATLVQLLHWFNPFIWLAWARMRADRELACDALALAHAPTDARRAYGQTIIKLLEGFARPSPLPGLVGILEDKGQMKRRIRMIAGHGRARHSPVFLPLLWPALAALALTDAQTNSVRSSEEAVLSNATMASRSKSAQTNADQTVLKIQGAELTLVSHPGSKELDRVEVRSNVVVEAGDFRLTADQMTITREDEKVVVQGNPPSSPGGGTYWADEPDRGHLARLGRHSSAGVVLAPEAAETAARQRPVVGNSLVAEPNQVAANMVEGVPWQPNAEPSDDSVLYTRFFRVDPNTLVRALEEMLGQSPEAPATNGAPALDGRGGALSQSPNSVTATNTATPTARFDKLKQVLASLGVDLAPPKALFYNDRLGMLMVRATRADLDTVEKVIQMLNVSPPQVTIEVKFAEVREGEEGGKDFLKTLGFDVRGSQPAPVTTELAPNLTNLQRAEFTGILTPSQYRAVLRALEQRNGVDLLSAPRVTTLSQRQAQIKAVDVQYVVTDLQEAEKKGDAPKPISEPIEFGPVLDVVPYVWADGATIQMTVIPTVREFLGYDLENAQLFQTGAPTNSHYPLPKFRVRQVVASASLWDGQTLVLGAGTVEDVEKAGPDPSAGTKRVRKSLFIFVTPTIIDPAGNPVHAPEEIPFRDRGVPPQNGPR